jgi:hypothetical protein
VLSAAGTSFVHCLLLRYHAAPLWSQGDLGFWKEDEEMTMSRQEAEQILDLLLKAATKAVDAYVKNSGESTDQMPEFVMSAGVAHHLSCSGISAILEANAKTLHRRSGTVSETEMESRLKAINGNLKNGRIDLVILSSDADPMKRKPIGFVEFKKWQYHPGDADRVATLLVDIPGAEFGACVILRDTPKDDPWHMKMRKFFGPDGIVTAEDINGRTWTDKPCCIVCVAKLRIA